MGAVGIFLGERLTAPSDDAEAVFEGRALRGGPERAPPLRVATQCIVACFLMLTIVLSG